MQIQAINGLSFRSNNKNKTTNVSTPLSMPNIQMKDTVSFGNTQLDAKQTALKIVKEIFTELTPANPEDYKGMTKELNTFRQSAKTAITKIKENLQSFSEAKIARYSLKEDELGATQIWASKRDGEIIFNEFNQEGKFLKGIEISPDTGFVRITAEIPAQQPLYKEAIGIINKENASIHFAEIKRYQDRKMDNIIESKTIRPRK